MQTPKLTFPPIRTLGLILTLACTSLTAQAQTHVPAGQRLRALGVTNDFLVGGWIGTAEKDKPDADYTGIAQSEFDLFTTEGDMLFQSIEPSQNTFSFADADELVAWAQSNDAKVHGAHLLWYYANPAWVTGGSWTASSLTAVMNNHINTIVTHFKGKVSIWNVVNEAIDASKSNADWKLNIRATNNIWNQIIGPTYIEQAFQTARTADPAALLIYNDYNQEQLNNKSDTMYNMVTDFINRGIPIDGVGFQCHWNSAIPDFASFAANLDRFSKLGMKICLTELDTLNPNGHTAEVPNANNDLQARTYYGTMDTALRCPAVISLEVCGINDRYSWLNHYNPDGSFTDNRPLPFDDYYQGYYAKPAYYALQDALNNHYRTELSTNGSFESGSSPWSNNGSGTLSIITSGTHSGSNAVSVTGRGGAWGGPAQSILSKLLVQGAGRYYLSCWAKFASGSGTVQIGLQTTDSTGLHYASIQGTVGTGWTHIAGWVNLGWTKTLTAASVYVDTPGTTADYYVDDIRAGDGNVVANGNFEGGLSSWTGINGATISSGTTDVQHHYGLKGVAVTGRTLSTQGPQQDILSVLQSQGAGNYNFESYMKLASGSGTGQIVLKLTYGGTDHLVTAASGTLNAVGWTKVISSAPVSVTWTGTLTAAALYLQTPGSTTDFYADEVLMRQ